MKDFWNSRYESETYAYGKEPNQFFKQATERLNLDGTLLLPAEGEGRNAIYAAKKGIEVSAYDISEEGKLKAERLAKQENVQIDYRVGELDSHNFEEESFDSIALIYAHFPNDKHQIHNKLIKLLKPNGYFILEGFSVDNLSYREKNPKVGGPANKNMLYSIDEMKSTFSNFEIIQLEQTETELKEGEYHNGTASVIRFIGRKIK